MFGRYSGRHTPRTFRSKLLNFCYICYKRLVISQRIENRRISGNSRHAGQVAGPVLSVILAGEENLNRRRRADVGLVLVGQKIVKSW